jgi:hypothetical protein
MEGHEGNVHTVFGRVIQGYPIVQAISEVDTGDQDRPRDPVRLLSFRKSDTHRHVVAPGAEAHDLERSAGEASQWPARTATWRRIEGLMISAMRARGASLGLCDN